MSYTGILSLEDICHYGKRCTATEKITKKLSTGQSKTVVQCKKYIIQKDKVSEEMIYYIGKQKQIILKDPIPLKELYPTIKHVYDQNGVLIRLLENIELIILITCILSFFACLKYCLLKELRITRKIRSRLDLSTIPFGE
nr:hypothetical protein FOCLOMLH_00002 [Enterococcus faecium]